MAVAKVTVNGNTIVNMTDATANASKILSSETAYIADGSKATGMASGGVTPTGTINIDDDGTYDVTNYASAEVAIDYESKVRTITFVVNRVDTSAARTINVYQIFGSSIDFSSGIGLKQYLFLIQQGESTKTVTAYVPKNRPIIVLGIAAAAGNYDVSIDSTYGEVVDAPHILGASNTHITKAIYLKSAAPDAFTITIMLDSQAAYPDTVVLNPLSVTSNGTYTAPAGTAYTPVTVDVPTGTPRTSSDLTVSGATVTAPAGLYSSNASASVASGTEGTPTATKGAVSNHSVSVTPSVTNAAGYISGGTHNGTAVSVSASELVSGTKSITSNGNNIDVTNYAAVDVAVPSQAPTLETKSVSYTPTETVQTDQLTPSAGYDGFDEVNVTVGAIDSYYVGSDVPRRTSANLVVVGNTASAASGYYANGASTTIMTGSMSVTATKGTVSNHSVTVTPKAAINNDGYFATGDRTGTAVTVTASELASGNKAISANGTNIGVVGYSTVSVAVPFSTITVSSSDPTGGSDGDVWIKTS